MRKVLLFVAAVLFLAPVSFADNWGAGVKLGYGENNPKAMKDLYDSIPADKELDENGGLFGLEVMYEWNLAEQDQLGVKIGADFYGQNKLKFPLLGLEAKENTYAFPLTVYYKKDNGVNKLSYFAGAGLTIIHTTVDISDASDIDKTKVFPHVVAGAEYRFTEVFALGLEAKYNFGAKMKKDDMVVSDRTGVVGALTGRFYF